MNEEVMHLAVGDADKRRDVAVQVQQRVHFDGAFMLAKPGPRKYRQAQIDGGRIRRIKALFQIDADWIGSIQVSRGRDQRQRKVGMDDPVPCLIGVGQRGTSHAARKPM